MRSYVNAAIISKGVNNYFTPPVAIDFDPKSNSIVILTSGREHIITALFRFTSLLAIFRMASLIENLIGRHRWDMLTFYLVLTFIGCFISFNRKITYGERCFFLIAMVYILAVVDLSFFGIGKDSRLYLFAFAILTTISLGWKSGIAAVFLGELTFVVIAWQISVGNIVITASQMASPIPSQNEILLFGLIFLVITSIVVAAVATIIRELEVAWRKELALSVAEQTKELRAKNTTLKTALGEIKILNGLLPICAQCKNIRDDNGSWHQIESYISEHSEAEFSHGICPDCTRELYPDLDSLERNTN